MQDGTGGGTDATSASSTVAAKIPGIPTVQFNGRSLSKQQQRVTRPIVCYRKYVSVIGDEPGVGEPPYGGLEADDAAERGRHPNGSWSIKQYMHDTRFSIALLRGDH
jgi:hypothetical protein